MNLISKNNKRNEVYKEDFDDFFKPLFNFNRNMMSMKTDIQECKDKYLVEVDLPGLDKKDIDLNMSKGEHMVYSVTIADKGDSYRSRYVHFNVE